MRVLIVVLVSCITVAFGSSNARVVGEESKELSIIVPKKIVDGDPPGLRIRGLTAGEIVRVHVLQLFQKYKEISGKWQQVPEPLHAWAEFAASADGQIDVDTAKPLKGTHSTPDSLALLRNGYPLGDPALNGVFTFTHETFKTAPKNHILVKLERGGKIVAEANFQSASAENLKFEDVAIPGLNGVFAKPADGKNLPIVIALHGSEGGNEGRARAKAAEFASKGFACLAVNYFAYDFDAIKGLPTKHANIPIEIIATARGWFEKRNEVDLKRFALYGVSKGAEFALVAATRYDCITAVVAVVPSDVVWQGFGDNIGMKDNVSSWSVDAKPLPFIPLFLPEDKKEGLYRINTERYERSREFHKDRELEFRIPIEKTQAKLLLLAGDRDEVWASGPMSRNLAERMIAAGKTDRVSLKIYPKVGHQIAGVGTFPIRLYGVQKDDPDSKDLIAEGAAAADAWKRTLQFLKEMPTQTAK